MSNSIHDQILPFFEKEDIENFKDKDYKKKFIDDLAENTKQNRKSVDITFNKLLKNTIKEKGISQDDFIKTRAKKFSNDLDLSADTKKVDVAESDQKKNESKDFPTTKNPKGKLAPVEKKEFPLEPIGGAVNSFLSAIFEDMEDLTETEKKDIGACLNMAFGDWIQTHDRARQVFGGVGILGIFGGKIKKARKAKKAKQLEEKIDNSLAAPVINEQDKNNFQQQSQEFIENKLQTDS